MPSSRDWHPETWHPETRLVHAGTERSQFGETSEALFLTQGYVYASSAEAERRFATQTGYVYSRYTNPTVTMFQDRIAALEGAEDARGTASGMAAVTLALQACLTAGDHVVAGRALFGSCRYVVGQFLPRFGVETTFVDGNDLDAWRAAVTPSTRAIFLESPTNPTLDVLDIPAICEIAHRVGAKVIVDNVFATPMLQRPLELGADIVVYSATKHIDGQGRCLSGVVLGKRDWIETDVVPLLKHTGPAMSPFNAWVLLKGLETMALRVERQSASAARIADVLAAHPAVTRLIYPGRDDHPQAALVRRQMSSGSTMIAFEVAGG
jgi:O-succinylhomoserine sulfhydrylase